MSKLDRVADRLTALREDGWRLTALNRRLTAGHVAALAYLGWPTAAEVARQLDEESMLPAALDAAIEQAADAAWQRLAEAQTAYATAGPVVFRLTSEPVPPFPSV